MGLAEVLNIAIGKCLSTQQLNNVEELVLSHSKLVYRSCPEGDYEYAILLWHQNLCGVALHTATCSIVPVWLNSASQIVFVSEQTILQQLRLYNLRRFTKKHYEALTGTLRNLVKNTDSSLARIVLLYAVRELAMSLVFDNSSFNPTLFCNTIFAGVPFTNNVPSLLEKLEGIVLPKGRTARRE